MTMLPSLRRQNILAELYVSRSTPAPLVTTPNINASSAGLKQTCPPGVFVSLTPGDPSLWSGVMFVRKGKSLPPPPRPRNLHNLSNLSLQGPTPPPSFDSTSPSQTPIPPSHPSSPSRPTSSTRSLRPSPRTCTQQIYKRAAPSARLMTNGYPRAASA